MGLGCFSGLMEEFIQESGKMIREMEKASWFGLMEENIQDNGKMENKTEKEAILLSIKKASL